MRVGEVNGRVVLFALLVTLGIYLAAGGRSVDEVAHAGLLNQTIPTMTPTGATSTPTTRAHRTILPTTLIRVPLIVARGSDVCMMPPQLETQRRQAWFAA